MLSICKSSSIQFPHIFNCEASRPNNSIFLALLDVQTEVYRILASYRWYVEETDSKLIPDDSKAYLYLSQIPNLLILAEVSPA